VLSLSLCAGDRESDKLSEHSSGSVFLSSVTDKPSLLSSLFHHQSREPDVIHSSVIGHKLADSVPPRSTSPITGEKSRSLPVERTQLVETSRPLSAAVTSHVFGTPAIMRRVSMASIMCRLAKARWRQLLYIEIVCLVECSASLILL